MSNICFNPAYQTSAKVQFNAFPMVEYETQSFTFPGIEAIYPVIATPMIDMPMAPEAVRYSPFTLNFLLDVNLEGYKSIAQWIQRMPNMASKDCFSDATVTLLSTQKTPIGYVKFIDMMPVSLGPIEYTIAVLDPQPLIATAEFRYLYYEFV